MVSKQAVAVVGVGAWGTVLALQLSRNGHRVRLWSHDLELAEDLRHERENKKFLPAYKLPDTIQIFTDAQATVQNVQAVVFVTASQFVRSTLEQFKPHLAEQVSLLNATKGLELNTNRSMGEVFFEVLGADRCERLAFLSGPNLSSEIAQQLPSTTVIASENAEVARYFQNLFHSTLFRVYTNSDVLGVQLGGTLKNAIALAAGILEGLGYGYNARAGLMVRGLAEITRLAVSMGAQQTTLYGLSGLGDLICTCSPASRNYSVGMRIGQGETLADIKRSMLSVAEGVDTAKVARVLAKQHHVDMPIMQGVCAILFDGRSAREISEQLMGRELKAEI